MRYIIFLFRVVWTFPLYMYCSDVGGRCGWLMMLDDVTVVAKSASRKGLHWVQLGSAGHVAKFGVSLPKESHCIKSGLSPLLQTHLSPQVAEAALA